MMTALFEEMQVRKPVIPGLSYIPNYIDKTQEAKLLSIIDNQAWMHDLKRRVQHYGYKYDYQARAITDDAYLGPLPGWLDELCQELYKKNIFRELPDQVIINEYLPGQGIAPHIDCIPCFGDIIASLSLGSNCVMDLLHDTRIKILLAARSLLVITGEARYKWQHTIAQRKADSYNGMKIIRSRRVSLTFRQVLVRG